MTPDITPLDGWIERTPERFEDRLFVTEDTQDRMGLIAVAHIAVYKDEKLVEYYRKGEYDFTQCETLEEVSQAVRNKMEGDA